MFALCTRFIWLFKNLFPIVLIRYPLVSSILDVSVFQFACYTGDFALQNQSSTVLGFTGVTVRKGCTVQ